MNLKNYEKLVIKFLYDFDFVAAEWRDDELFCYTGSYEELELSEFIPESKTHACWAKLEDTLRQRNVAPFALDTPRSEMNT